MFFSTLLQQLPYNSQTGGDGFPRGPRPEKVRSIGAIESTVTRH
jgi:hypothetical protein